MFDRSWEIAAIYGRKSPEQAGAGDKSESVERQLAHAVPTRRVGWTVDEADGYVDDGISGAEFLKRPGFLRLMNTVPPRPPFQVLTMSEESRLGREQIETAYALKQLVQAGVRVWLYLGPGAHVRLAIRALIRRRVSEPQTTIAQIDRILVPGGVFAACDYDWPRVIDWRAGRAFRVFVDRIIELRRQHGLQHFTRLSNSGRFRHVREVLLHQTERCTADR